MLTLRPEKVTKLLLAPISRFAEVEMVKISPRFAHVLHEKWCESLEIWASPRNFECCNSICAWPPFDLSEENEKWESAHTEGMVSFKSGKGWRVYSFHLVVTASLFSKCSLEIGPTRVDTETDDWFHYTFGERADFQRDFMNSLNVLQNCHTLCKIVCAQASRHVALVQSFNLTIWNTLADILYLFICDR